MERRDDMPRKITPGLRLRGGVWHVDKRVKELPGVIFLGMSSLRKMRSYCS